MSWIVLCSVVPRCCGTAVMPERFGEEDPSCVWDGEPTLVCTSVRARGEPTLPAGGYGAAPPAAFGCREVSEPTRRTAEGEAGLCRPYGEPARCTGRVLEEYPWEGRGRCSATLGEPYPPPRDVRSEPRDGDTPVLTT